MTKRDRGFSSSDQSFPSPDPAFNPGGDDFSVVRMIDGHDPTAEDGQAKIGLDASNVHQPSASRIGDDAFDTD